jgi:hypothetical protein
MNEFEWPKLDRTAFRVTTFEEAEAEDRAYWHSRTPEERLAHMEFLRRINYGNAANGRMERVLEVADGPAGGTALSIDERAVDRTAFSVIDLETPTNDLLYWLTKTPEERLRALELTRQTLHGYSFPPPRLQRVLEIAERGEG